MAANIKNTRCVVIGGNGLVGSRMCSELTKWNIAWEGTFCSRPKDGLIQLNVTDQSKVENVIKKYSPRAVFLCANLAGGVEFCESNPQTAMDFHLNAAKGIGICCKELGATLVFISSDYVFDGTKGPYREDDVTNPLNLYGRLKLEAEQWIQEKLKKHLIIRTTNVYGWDPQTVTPNYIMSLYRSLKEGRPFNAASFLWGNPTYVGDLVTAIIELFMNNANGLFHVVGRSFINRLAWADLACKVLKLNCSLINEIKEPPPDMVPRPLKSCLNTDKFTSRYKTVLHSASDGLKLMKSDMNREQESPVLKWR